MGAGGYSLGLRDPGTINYQNPASYTSLDTLSFVFEGGILDQYFTIKSTQASASNNYITLGYLNFGIPVTRWWKTSFGLLPFSNVGYNISDDDVIDNIGPVSYLYEGSGGINQLYWGHGFSITPRLSAGFNAAYLFGTLDKRRSAIFPDTSYSFNLRFIDQDIYHDVLLTFGLQYDHLLRNNHYLRVGAIYGHKTNIRSTNDQIAYTFAKGSTGIEFPKDTIVQTSGEKGDVVFPQRFGMGLTIGKQNRWEAGMDYQWQRWETYAAHGIRDSLRNSAQISAGVQFIPDYASVSNYWEKITYRFGLRYESTYLELKENQLSEVGISFGLGLPLRRSRSTLNVGMEFGRRGTTADNLIQQNFVRFSFGVSVYERWFVKRRYD
ncbi:MAG: hypothetical protein KA053_04355 [Lentimicrobiaceae bacterium]|nr:hypothetical protein [Lentimicrobiaceae bacterium]